MSIFSDHMEERRLERIAGRVRPQLAQIGQPRDPDFTSRYDQQVRLNAARREASEQHIPLEERLLEDARKPRGVVGKVLDLLSRGEYFSASLVNNLVNEESTVLSAALSEATMEALAPRKRRTFHDVISTRFPEFSKEHPFWTGVFSLGASIALDPTTYISFGGAGATKAVSKIDGLVMPLVSGKATTRAFTKTAERLRALDPLRYERRLGDVEVFKGEKSLLQAQPSTINPYDDVTEAILDIVHPDRTANLHTGARALDEIPEYQEIVASRHAKIRNSLRGLLNFSESRKSRGPGNLRVERVDPLAPTKPILGRWEQVDELDEVANDLDFELFADAPDADFLPGMETMRSVNDVRLSDAQKVQAVEMGSRSGQGALFPERFAEPGTRIRGRANALPTNFEQWGFASLDGGTMLQHATQIKDGLHTARYGELTPLTRAAVGTLKPLGDTPVLALVPPTMMEAGAVQGRVIARHARIADLFFLLPNGRVAQGDEVMTFLRGSRADFEKALEAQKRANDLSLSNFMRIQRANVTKETLESLGLSAERLRDQGGLKFFGKSVVSDARARKIAHATGLAATAGAIARLPGVAELRAAKEALLSQVSREVAVKSLFKRVGITADNIERTWRRYEDARGMVELQHMEDLEEAEALAVEAGSLLRSRDSESRVVNAMLSAQDASTKMLDEINSDAALQGLPPATTLLQETEARLLDEAMTRASLLPSERDWVVRMVALRERNKDVAAQAGLFSSMLLNYTPVRWQLTNPVRRFLSARKAIVDPHLPMPDGSTPVRALALSPSDHEVFRLAEHARAAGWEPVGDVVTQTSLDFMQIRNAQRMAEHDEVLRALLPETIDKKTRDALKKDFYRIMRHEPGIPQWHDSIRAAVRMTDRFTSLFKRSATIYNPAYMAKQLTGNVGQLAAAGGLKGFDPTAWHAAILMAFRKQPPKEIIDGLGRRHTSEDILRYFREFPVLRSTVVEGITSNTVDRAMRRARQQVDAARAVDAFGNRQLPEARGMAALLQRALPYTDYPGKIEDLMRSASFLSFIGRGHSPAEAYRLMEKGLFNYVSDLTQFEERFLGRLVPFYRWNKFAASLTVTALKESPGRVANIAKTAREIGRVWHKIEQGVFQGLGPEREDTQLTPSERHAVPDWMFEQPSAFVGIDPVLKQAAFRTFNGLSFLDWMSFLEMDDKGEFSPEKTVVSGAMSQFAPFVKVPLEVLFKTEFFNMRELTPDARNLGQIDSEEFFRMLSTTVAATVTGSVGGAALGAAAGTAATAASGMLERLGANGVVRQITGWERATDPRDGKSKVYINPYMLLVASAVFPSIRTVLATSREDRHPMEKVLRLVMGINTITLDLRKEARHQRLDALFEFREEVDKVKRMLRQGRQDPAQEARENLRLTLEQMRTESELLGGSAIRGRGI